MSGLLGISVRLSAEVGQKPEKEQRKQKLSTWVRIVPEVHAKKDYAIYGVVQLEDRIVVLAFIYDCT